MFTGTATGQGAGVYPGAVEFQAGEFPQTEQESDQKDS